MSAHPFNHPALHTQLVVRGARTHNLKNVDIDIPKYALVVITGLSGSGKSSLAFDTLYAEGQRRYVESLSTYARQFLQLMDKPDVDVIEGLSPAIAIEQKATSHNPRSTVGTITEIHDYLRLLYARAGTPYCPEHDAPLAATPVAQMVDELMQMAEGSRWMILAPVARQMQGSLGRFMEEWQSRGYVRFRITLANGSPEIMETVPSAALESEVTFDADVVIDRIRTRSDDPNLRQRLAESFEAALRLSNGRAIAAEMESELSTQAPHEWMYSRTYACPHCSYTLPELEPRLFSFNSPIGACTQCDGLGQLMSFDEKRVVAFPELSLASGAIKGWDRRNDYTFGQLEALAKHYGFDLEDAFESLSPQHQRVILHGSGEEHISFTYSAEGANGKRRQVKRQHPFEGVIPTLERRWRETDVPAVREDLGRMQTMQPCPLCHGHRLKREARHVFLQHHNGERGHPIYTVGQMTLAACRSYFDALQLRGSKADIAQKVINEIRSRLRFLTDVGLTYLSLDRSADTLSGGEAQRIRLASQIGSGLTGVMYVLDEPSIGLHQRDNERLIHTLKHLRDLGNSVIVVEHDEDMIRTADYVIDMGPGAGVHGGQVMAQGSPAEVIANPDSLTGQYLGHALRIAVPTQRKSPPKSKLNNPSHLRIIGASGNNLQNVSVDIPIGVLTCVTGVSGSGKSTLINDTLYAVVARQLYGSQLEPQPYDSIEGLEAFDKVINVDQSPIGRTPRSNPATYTGVFTAIRDLYTEVPSARERGYGPGRFSFNVAASSGGGRCESCQGDGVVKVEMHFLPDVYVPCDVCHGARYNRETLEIIYRGKNISEVLDLTVEDAYAFFQAIPAIARKLQTLLEVGLGYIKLGQSALTLSGGEAQRVKLALELSKRDTGRTLYILDEPTTGLHFHDIALLLKVLEQLRDAGNTIVIIEHNLDVIKTADWIIDIGPEGGSGGGQVVAVGTPEAVAACPQSHTGKFLKTLLP